MRNYVLTIASIITKKEGSQFLFTLTIVAVTDLLEMVSVAALVPFVSIITDPALLESNWLSRPIGAWLDEKGLPVNQKVSALAGAFALLFCLACGLRVIGNYLQVKFVLTSEQSLSERLLKVYLSKPFTHLARLNSTEVSAAVLADASAVAGGIIQPILTISAQGITIISLVGFMLIYDYSSTLAVAGIAIITYLVAYVAVGSRVARAGVEKVEANRRRYSIVAAAFASPRNLKAEKMESDFHSRFLASAKIYTDKQALQHIAASAPRYLVEALLMLFVVITIIGFLASGNISLSDELPKYSAFLLAGYRIVPAAQQIYAATNSVNFNTPALEKIQAHLQEAVSAHEVKETNNGIILSDRIKNINIKGLGFRYGDQSRFIFGSADLDLEGTGLIGITGPSGAGKTTLIDILMGLIEPIYGVVTIDGYNLSSISNFHDHIGFVPQDLWLFDGTIAENISLEIGKENLNENRLRDAVKKVTLQELIENEMQHGYQTQIGDRGQLLSGGQRQRLAIARALYKDPQILILDEPTSALDSKSEEEVMRSLTDIAQSKLVLIVSHRSATLTKCDRTVEVRDGYILERTQITNS